MLRPATPLAILLFAAFALLLLAVLSTPIIKGIPLGEFKGASYGVFGYCDTPTHCSPIEIGYDAGYTKVPNQEGFDLDLGTRSKLSAILIVHPVAALLTLIMFIMAVTAHFHSPSHSSRYLLVVFIFSIITFLVCLLCFLVDVLLFVPHMAWGSYIVLAAAILVFLSLIVSCAMRRTLVSRKARKKRIAENAEMSGENYYNREAQRAAVAAASQPVQPTVPVMSGGNNDKLPTFASYESRNDNNSDERIPLTQTSPMARSMTNRSNEQVNAPTLYSQPSQSSSNHSPPRDQYGNPMNQGQDAYSVGRVPSQERMRGRGGGPSSFRGRGGYERGGYGGRGGYGPGPNGRGGYGPPGRGGYGPPGPNGRGGAYGPRGGYANGAPRGGRQTPTGYQGPGPQNRGPSPANAYGNYGQQGAYAMNAPPGMAMIADSDLPRAESPPPLPGSAPAAAPYVGQAVEMNASTGSPAHPPQGFGHFNGQLRDSDADVAGMLALQQGRMPPPPNRHDTMMTEGSSYSQDDSQYVPPRQAWNSAQNRSSPGIPSPLAIPQRIVESPEGNRPQAAPAAGGAYYEDVDPRFAQPAPGARNLSDESIDDLHNHPGSRSPAISERSGFTSVSQRPVNPRWNPNQGQGYAPMPARRPVNRGPDLLDSNPDFQLPGAKSGANPRIGGPGMITGGAYPAM